MALALLPGLFDGLLQLPGIEAWPERGGNGLVFLRAVVVAEAVVREA